MISDADYQFKIVLVGNSSVGKSSLLKRFADDEFKDSYQATIGVDFRFKSLKVRDKLAKLQIWDTAGQERFRTITGAYYKNAQGIIVVFDLQSQKSFQDVEEYWFSEIQKYAESNVQVAIFGNKADREDRVISRETAQKYAESKGVEFSQVSAKTGDEVNEAVLKLVRKLVDLSPQGTRQEQSEYKAKVLQNIKKKKLSMQVRGGNEQKKDCAC